MKAGDLVVIDAPADQGRGGVFRVERVLDNGRLRCFSYVDGGFVIVDADVVRPCPPNTPAAP